MNASRATERQACDTIDSDEIQREGICGNKVSLVALEDISPPPSLMEAYSWDELSWLACSENDELQRDAVKWVTRDGNLQRIVGKDGGHQFKTRSVTVNPVWRRWREGNSEGTPWWLATISVTANSGNVCQQSWAQTSTSLSQQHFSNEADQGLSVICRNTASGTFWTFCKRTTWKGVVGVWYLVAEFWRTFKTCSWWYWTSSGLIRASNNSECLLTVIVRGQRHTASYHVLRSYHHHHLQEFFNGFQLDDSCSVCLEQFHQIKKNGEQIIVTTCGHFL